MEAIQLSLLDGAFNLSPEKMAFAEEYVRNGGDGGAAMLSVRPHLTKGSAQVRAHEWLGKRRQDGKPAKHAGDPELLRYIDALTLRVRLQAAITHEELAQNYRRNYLYSVGAARLRKSIVRRSVDEESGEETLAVEDVEVFETNLSAANTAVEGLRKLGGFGKDLTPGAPGGEAPPLSRTERAARVAALLEKARRERADADDAA